MNYQPRAMKNDEDDRQKLIQSNPSDKGQKMGKGFRIIELVACIVFAVVKKFWKLCTSIGLILLLTFWYHGGYITLLLLGFALMGKMNCRVQLFLDWLF